MYDSIKDFFSPLTNIRAISLIVVIGIMVYFFALFNGFVADDEVQIVGNSAIHTLANLTEYFTGSTFYNAGARLLGSYYKPLLSTYYSIVYIFSGQNPFFYHFLQLLLHISNSCILFLIFNKYFKKTTALFLALVFLVHPINSEAVLYISAAQDTLFFFFGILALYTLINLKTKKQLIIVGACFLLSLFSKETGILFICIGIIYPLFFNRKIFLPVFIYAVGASFIYLVLRINAIGLVSESIVAPISKLSLSERLITMPSIFLLYLSNFIIPLNFSSSYLWVHTNIDFNNVILPAILVFLFIGVIVVFGFFLFQRKQKKYLRLYLFFSIWFLLGVIMHLQIVPLDSTAADRWFYFPIAGLLGMIGITLSVFKVNFQNKWIIVVAIIIILSLSTRTLLRSYDWKDNRTLANHDIKITPESYVLENAIGSDLIDQNKLLEARVHIDKSIELFPYLTNYLNLGVIHMRLGKYEEAKEANIKALNYADYYVVYENMAALYLVSGDPSQGIEFIQSSLKKFPQDGKLWLYLAILNYRLGNMDEAQVAVQQAYYFEAGQGTEYIYDVIMNGKELNLNLSNGPK